MSVEPTAPPTLAELREYAFESYDSFDALNTRIIEQSGVRLACRAGCSLCCSLRVDVFAHEVLVLADHIRASFSSVEVEDLLVRLDARAEKVLPLTPFEHATQNIPCALLRDNGQCSVYMARPQCCRRHHSRDLAACQYTYDHPADLDFPGAHDRALYRTLTAAMQAGIDTYAELGFDTTIYELGTALREALTDPASWDRWREGGRAFLHASETPSA